MVILLTSILYFLSAIIFYKKYRKNSVAILIIAGSIFLIYLLHKNWQLEESTTGSDSLIRVNNMSALEIVKLKETVLIDVPVISQFPELERGCEVTSLAMLLNHAGISVDKMELSERIKKNPAKYKKVEGKVHFGDPHEGFVGDIYTRKNPGLGVYHKPIAELAGKYLPEEAVFDLTGQSFESVMMHLSEGRPVWVIINITYKKLPDSHYQTWMTPNGEIKITYKEHSVLITGYDENFIYFNDPYDGQKKWVPANDFIAAWEQMGRQAITYIKPGSIEKRGGS